MDRELLIQAGIDCDDGLHRFSGNEQLYSRVLKVFLQDPSFSEILPALDAENLAAASAQAHALKGASGNLGMKPLYTLCMQFMQAANNGEAAEARRLYTEMAEAYQKVCTAIATL